MPTPIGASLVLAEAGGGSFLSVDATLLWATLVVFALFVMILEILVAFIQAYIFTLLSATFIGMYAHPAH